MPNLAKQTALIKAFNDAMFQIREDEKQYQYNGRAYRSTIFHNLVDSMGAIPAAKYLLQREPPDASVFEHPDVTMEQKVVDCARGSKRPSHRVASTASRTARWRSPRNA